MTFDEYAEKYLSALTPEGRRLVQMGWNGCQEFGDGTDTDDGAMQAAREPEELKAVRQLYEDALARERELQARLQGGSEGGEAVAYRNPEIDSVITAKAYKQAIPGAIGGCTEPLYTHPTTSQPDKWIPCSERLPTEAESGDDGCGDAWVTDGKKVWSAPAFRLESSDPFLWMPIDSTKPAPPEQESE